MTPANIIQKAQSDGVRLSISPTGTIKATGDGAAVNRWLGAIRENKAGIIEALKVGAGDTVPMTAEQETAIRAWLVAIGETDPVIIADVLAKCQRDLEALAYFVGRAAAEL